MEISNKQVVFLRAGFLGDLLVSLPFIFYVINKNNLSFKNVFFISFQRTNINQELINKKVINFVSLIFGKSFDNSYVVTNYSVKDLQNCVKEIRKRAHKPEIAFVYLPFGKEKKIDSIKKWLYFLKSGIRLNELFFAERNHKTNSEYLKFFKNVENINFGIDSLRMFLNENNSYSENSKIIFNNSILVYPNSQLKIKIWPLNSFINLIHEILSKYDYNILLIGSQDDFEYNEIIVKQLNNNRVFNVAGKFSVEESLVYYKSAKMFIGNDGGPMHMAAIANIPVIGLFSFKEELGIWDPTVSKSYVTFRTNVGCKVCNKLACNSNICMQLIEISDILIFVESILKGDQHQKIIVNSSYISQYSISS